MNFQEQKAFRIEHGAQIQTSVLGAGAIVRMSTALTDSFLYEPSPVIVGHNAQFIVLLNEVYCLLEVFDSSQFAMVLPCALAKSYASESAQRRSLLLEPSDVFKLFSCMNSQLTLVEPMSLCVRGNAARSELCIVRLLSRDASLEELEGAVTRLMDMSLVLWDQSNQSGSHQITSLMAGVRAHQV